MDSVIPCARPVLFRAPDRRMPVHRAVRAARRATLSPLTALRVLMVTSSTIIPASAPAPLQLQCTLTRTVFASFAGTAVKAAPRPLEPAQVAYRVTHLLRATAQQPALAQHTPPLPTVVNRARRTALRAPQLQTAPAA